MDLLRPVPRRALAASLLLALAPACGQSQKPTGPTGKLSVDVAALKLDGVANASWRLTVANADGQTVWTQSGLTADKYGDGAGSLAYVGTCDASGSGDNTVELVLEDLFSTDGTTAPIPQSTYQNPCGDPGADPVGPSDDVNYDGVGPCVRHVHCVENADTAVKFDITVIRDADQGFFDVAVNFADIFCSAKLDCVDGLLHDPAHPDAGRKAAFVMGFACTSGTDESRTYLYLSDVDVVCKNPASSQHVDMHVAQPGNQGPRGPFFQVASYIGEEQLPDLEKCYWNTTFGIDPTKLIGECTLEATGTASPTRFVWPGGVPADGHTPPDAIYPVIHWSVPITNAQGAVLCQASPLDGAGSGVQTGYTTFDGATFAHELACGGDVVTFGRLDCPHNVPALGGKTVSFRQAGSDVSLQIDGKAATRKWTLGGQGLSLVGCCADPCCDVPPTTTGK